MAPTKLTDLNDDVLLCIFDTVERDSRRRRVKGLGCGVVNLTSTCQRFRRLGTRVAFQKIGTDLLSGRQLK
jgi:hypothetical protein